MDYGNIVCLLESIKDITEVNTELFGLPKSSVVFLFKLVFIQQDIPCSTN